MRTWKIQYIERKALALHMAHLCSITSIPHGPLSMQGEIPKCRTRSNPWAFQGLVLKQKIQQTITKKSDEKNPSDNTKRDKALALHRVNPGGIPSKKFPKHHQEWTLNVVWNRPSPQNNLMRSDLYAWQWRQNRDPLRTSHSLVGAWIRRWRKKKETLKFNLHG